jgi:hypothetical protein
LVGTDIDFLFCTLDARPTKQALASTGSDLALSGQSAGHRSG